MLKRWEGKSRPAAATTGGPANMVRRDALSGNCAPLQTSSPQPAGKVGHGFGLTRHTNRDLGEADEETFT